MCLQVQCTQECIRRQKNWVILELFSIKNARTPELLVASRNVQTRVACGSDVLTSIWIIYNCHVAVCHVSIVALKILFFILFASFKIQQVRFSNRYTLLFQVLNFLAFIERDKRIVRRWPLCIQRSCCSCHMSYQVQCLTFNFTAK